MNEIIREWERRVRNAFSSARQLDRGVLIDSLPEILDDLANLLSFPVVTAFDKAREKHYSIKHGAQRSRKTDFTVEEVIIECFILQDVLLESLDTPSGEGLTGDERRVILNAIQLIITQATQTYVAETQEQTLYREAELNHLINAVNDYAIMMMDPNGFFLKWNPGAERLKLWKPEEAIQRHFTVLYRAEDLWKPPAELKLAFENGKSEDEGWRKRKDGTMFWANVIITPIWENGKLRGFSKVARDITERARLEENLRHNVAALSEEKRARERFVLALSHDLRNPLTAAKVAAEIMTRYPEKTDSREERYKLSAKIMKSLTRADQMIQDLLDASRIEAGAGMPIEVHPCDLVLMVREIADDLEPLSGGRVTIAGPEQIPGFWSESNLRRAVENLITNALKYGDAQTPVQVLVTNDQTHVWIRVNNRGPVIPAEQLPKLFKPFHRGPTEGEKTARGWGIGLTLVKGIVEAHQGRVWAESSERDGTTFVIELPNTAQNSSMGRGTRKAEKTPLPGDVDLNRA